VSNAFWAKWVRCFVRCTTGTTFQRRVGAGIAGLTSWDCAKVVVGAVLLGTDSTCGFLRFAEFGVVAVTLAVTAVGVRGPREVWCDAAFLVAECKCGCTKVFEIDRT
jgi:hypothetical protein